MRHGARDRGGVHGDARRPPHPRRRPHLAHRRRPIGEVTQEVK